ncbi:unnamed protein product [Linum tenue]|uniref:Uncharacterized protein n=1 Tax=Linum tenue TaxID=586396 RepID=A0AAV0RQR8_9ROSI|nr:unnamed protein product [Linum tenue]
MPRRTSSSGNFARKLQPAKRALRRLAHKLRSDIPRAIRFVRNGTKRVVTYCSTHLLLRNNNNINRSSSLQIVAKTPSYRSHNHHSYISDYYSSSRNLLRKSFSAIFIDQLYAADDGPPPPAAASTSDEHYSISKPASAAAAAETTTDRVEIASVRGKEVAVSNSNEKRPPLPRSSCREGAAVRTASSLVQRRKREALVIMEEVGGNKNNNGDENGNNNPMETLEDAWREVVARSPQLQPVDVRAEEFIHNFRADMKIQKARSVLEKQSLLPRRC